MASNPRLDELRKRFERERGSRVFAQFAEELRRAGETAEAIRVSREGLALHPSYTTARITLGRALLDGGEVEGAAREFQGVLKTTPDNLIASRYMGECLEKRGEVAAALQHYEKALLFSPGDEWIKGRVVALGSAAEAGARGGPASGGAPILPRDEGARLPTGPVPVPGVAQEEATTLPGLPTGGVVGEAAQAATAEWGAAQAGEMEGVRTAEAAVASGPPVASAASVDEPDQRAAAVPAHEEEEFELETPAASPERGQRPQLTFRPLLDDEGGAAEFMQRPIVDAEDDRLPTAPLNVPESVLAWTDRAAEAAAAVPVREEQAGADVATVALKPGEAGAAELASPTLAELYLRQGSPARALEMYQTLLARDPGNAALQARAAELRRASERPAARVEGSGGREDQVRRVVARLEGLLSAVRSATPAGGARG